MSDYIYEKKLSNAIISVSSSCEPNTGQAL